MATQTQGQDAGRAYPAGTRLRCEECGAEVEIITPCGCSPPDQILRCCDREMTPTAQGSTP